MWVQFVRTAVQGEMRAPDILVFVVPLSPIPCYAVHVSGRARQRSGWDSNLGPVDVGPALWPLRYRVTVAPGRAER